MKDDDKESVESINPVVDDDYKPVSYTHLDVYKRQLTALPQ